MIPFRSFYLIRHGQSVHNEQGLISGGGSDPDLTELGRAQGARARDSYAGLADKPTRVIVSGLKRAHQTALILTDGGEVFVDADLNERHLGDHDGKISEAEQKSMAGLPNEETSRMHAERVLRAVRRHLERESLPLFVCHAGTIRRVMEELGLQGRLEVENARLYHVVCRGREWDILEIG